jgi:hypothetical protein
MKNIVLSAGIIFSFIALLGCFNTNKEPTEWREYVVRSGDTVCDISIDITPNGQDYRYTQYCIIEKNNIENAMIYPGQTILVPVCE